MNIDRLKISREVQLGGKWLAIEVYCKICNRVIEEESPYCEISDCPYREINLEMDNSVLYI